MPWREIFSASWASPEKEKKDNRVAHINGFVNLFLVLDWFGALPQPPHDTTAKELQFNVVDLTASDRIVLPALPASSLTVVFPLQLLLVLLRAPYIVTSNAD